MMMIDDDEDDDDDNDEIKSHLVILCVYKARGF